MPILLRACLVCLLVVPALSLQAQDGPAVQRLLAGGDAAGALAAAETALAAAPKDARLAFLRGVALMDLRRDDEAAAQFGRLTQEHPELAEPHNNLALLHARAGRLDAALASLQTALRNDPSSAEARANLGEVHLRLAIQAWDGAVKAAPDDRALADRLRRARELVAPAR